MENVELTPEQVAEKLKSVETLDAKLESIQKSIANIEKAQIVPSSECEKLGKSYSYLSAKKDIATGKTANVPLWDDKTAGRFGEYLQMIKSKDFDGIRKAFGDNVQDNLANWIPTEFRPELIRLAYLNSIALQKATIIPMSRDKVTMPAPTGNYTVSWITAGNQITDSKVTPGYVTLDSKKLGALALINNEDLADSAYPIAQFVASQMGQDFGNAIDLEVFQSYGSAFSGLDSASNVQAVTGSVDATPTFAELLTQANITAARGKLDMLQSEGAEWYFTPDAWAAIRSLAAANGGFASEGNYKDYIQPLFGFPVNVSTRVGPAATAAKAAGFFGNLKHVYIGDRMDLTIQTSDQYRFAEDQTAFKAIQRIAIAVGIPTAFVRIMFGAAA